MSKKTLPNHRKKTESARRKNPLGLWLGVALIFFGLFAVLSGVMSLTDNKTRLFAPDGSIIIEKVESEEDKRRGLSGRESLSEREGMLFVFDQASIQNCFWMKDMLFSIDMIWLDADKSVVTVTGNVTPETYPESFCPTVSAKYGLEVVSGRAETLGITTGETLRF